MNHKERLNEFVKNHKKVCITSVNPMLSITGYLRVVVNHFVVESYGGDAIFQTSQVTDIREDRIPEITVTRREIDED